MPQNQKPVDTGTLPRPERDQATWDDAVRLLGLQADRLHEAHQDYKNFVQQWSRHEREQLEDRHAKELSDQRLETELKAINASVRQLAQEKIELRKENESLKARLHAIEDIKEGSTTNNLKNAIKENSKRLDDLENSKDGTVTKKLNDEILKLSNKSKVDWVTSITNGLTGLIAGGVGTAIAFFLLWKSTH